MARGRSLVAIALLAMAAGGCAAPYAERPPIAYRGDAALLLRVVQPSLVDGSCRALGATTPPGQRVNACERGGLVILPNPCARDFSGVLAELLCHELGHVNGWPATHPTKKEQAR